MLLPKILSIVVRAELPTPIPKMMYSGGEIPFVQGVAGGVRGTDGGDGGVPGVVFGGGGGGTPVHKMAGGHASFWARTTRKIHCLEDFPPPQNPPQNHPPTPGGTPCGKWGWGGGGWDGGNTDLGYGGSQRCSDGHPSLWRIAIAAQVRMGVGVRLRR